MEHDSSLMQRLNSPTATGVRAALNTLDGLARSKDCHLELELLGKLHAGVWSGYLLLQVCRDVPAGTIVELERRIGAADDQLGRAARALYEELTHHTI